MFSENYVYLNDKHYKIWLKDRKVYNILINIISLVINFKFRNVIFSKLFALKIFYGQLESIKKFKISGILSFFSLIYTGIVIFIGISTIKVSKNYIQF